MAAKYMTGGNAIILGSPGSNFGAGMTGGMAYILDTDRNFAKHANPESIIWQRLDSAHWEAQLIALIEAHQKATDSKWSEAILRDWDRWRKRFWQVCPKEMLNRIEHPLSDKEAIEAAE